MIESNLEFGAQTLNPGKTKLESLKYGQSVTDECIDIPMTEASLRTLAASVRARRALLASED
jgi:3-deoxy-7-phosphoheptulonate synthase